MVCRWLQLARSCRQDALTIYDKIAAETGLLEETAVAKMLEWEIGMKHQQKNRLCCGPVVRKDAIGQK